ncbi:phytanoyl-CoA dioxygenase family protein [Burkholderia sp. F1]|uniref:phytanoyl-CoA dioxygenase family protein n=1 Tax=Burkholderia sp. F1 TaxID=3366817 RepID=UPI003D741BEB
MAEFMLSDSDKAAFNQNGVVVLRGFHDVERDILPIQKAIYEIIGLVMDRHGLSIQRERFSPSCFDSGFSELIQINRDYGGEVYDIVKQIPAFLRLISGERSEALFCSIRGTDFAGIGTASYGIRIDNPGEEKFRSQWHQEYLFQPQSMDGIVLWTPLMPILPETGPVIYCLGSHQDGLRKYIKDDAYAGKSGAYKISMLDEETVANQYEQSSPLTQPGDVIVMDYLTIHQSGFNRSVRSRWSIQSRFFNFRDPSGMEIGWKGAVAAGTEIETIFADYFVRGVQ